MSLMVSSAVTLVKRLYMSREAIIPPLGWSFSTWRNSADDSWLYLDRRKGVDAVESHSYFISG